MIHPLLQNVLDAMCPKQTRPLTDAELRALVQRKHEMEVAALFPPKFCRYCESLAHHGPCIDEERADEKFAPKEPT
jgi:hypothetical protein